MPENQPINITQLSIEQLKAMAYDLVTAIQNASNNLQAINNEIAKRNQPKKTEPVKEKKKKDENKDTGTN